MIRKASLAILASNSPVRHIESVGLSCAPDSLCRLTGAGLKCSSLFRYKKMIYLIALSAAVSIAVGLTSPQGRLFLRASTGQFEFHPVPVTAFSAIEFNGEVEQVGIDALTLNIPRGAEHSSATEAGTPSMSVMMKGLGMLVCRPLPNGLIQYGREMGFNTSHSPDRDEVSLEAAAFAADPQKASLWMSRDEANELDALLTLRSYLGGDITRAEIVRGDNIKGVLVTRDLDNGRICLVFSYFAANESLSGTALFCMESHDEDAVRKARAIVSSFRIAAPPVPLTRSVTK